MICSEFSPSQKSSSTADSLPPSPPELVSDSSEDDESVESIDLAVAPPPLLGPDTHSKDHLHTHSPSLEEPRDVGSVPVLPVTGNESQTDSHARHLPRAIAAYPGPQTPIWREKTRSRRCTDVSTTIGGQKSTLSPDRFIPLREFIDSPSTPFRIGKCPQELSREERFLRHRSPREDPFMPTRQRRSANAPRIPVDRIHSTNYGPRLVNDSAIRANQIGRGTNVPLRQISVGAVWHVGGTSAALGRRPVGVSGGPGVLLASGTTAPMYNARFIPQPPSIEDQRKYESRVALALDIDPATRLLKHCKLWPLLESTPSPSSPHYERSSPLVWKDNAWKRVERDQWETDIPKVETGRIGPTRPFRILDAPLLRDDFYCSTLAYSPTSGILAVGLGHRVYLWSEAFGVQYPPLRDQHPSNHVTSLSFSSENGGKSILAIARHSGTVCLWSTFDNEVRFEVSHPDTVTCVAFKQTKSRRLSERFQELEVDAEDLAVGDYLGNIWYYSVEWPEEDVREQFDWQGTMTLLAKIAAHTQQVCGITWSPDGTYLATGGNDNSCLIFELHDIIPARELGTINSCLSFGAQIPSAFSSFTASASRLLDKYHLVSHLLPPWSPSPMRPLSTSLLSYAGSLVSGGNRTTLVPPNRQKHRLVHSAAVKAIAFAPWQPSLLATGGGSNDRAIHFYHTPSGACLATINVYAQVTSLIWSKTRREIAATFGFAQPEHPFRIAVFAWPSCEQIVAIPWGPYGSSWEGLDNASLVDCGRALCAVSYPGRLPAYVFEGIDDPESSSTAPSTIQERLRRRGRSAHCPRTIGRTNIRPRAKEGGLWCSRTVEEGCIIVASSDESVKFHEVWSSARRSTAATSGPYGGSEILEGLEGLEKPGNEIIR